MFDECCLNLARFLNGALSSCFANSNIHVHKNHSYPASVAR
jgi:hypothetical protein